MTTIATFSEIKAKQRATWGSGDYGKIAWVTVPVADATLYDTPLPYYRTDS